MAGPRGGLHPIFFGRVLYPVPIDGSSGSQPIKIILKHLAGLGILLLLLLAVAAFRTPGAADTGAQHEIAADLPLDAEQLGANLATSLTFPTESQRALNEGGSPEFEGMIDWLRETYPLVHQKLQLERVNDYALLYTWQGSDPDLLPLALTGHYDVVPGGSEVDQAKWDHPPFAGVIADGVIYGRGALDDKTNVIGLLEACEHLLSTGFVPRQTIYLAFGHDEETGGARGALAIAELLQTRGIELEFVLDEGGAVMPGSSMGLAQDVALIGLAEKGSVSVDLSVDNSGPTHSSMPMLETPLGILSSAIIELESNQMPSRITSVVANMLDSIAPHMPYSKRLAISNRWLFGSMILSGFEQDPQQNSMIRTTTAPTMISGGPKENVLPTTASAVVNFRILPGDDVDSVVTHVKQVISDPRVIVEGREGRNPSGVSSVDTAAYGIVAQTIHQTFGNVVPTPYLVMGGTDARHYEKVSKNQYRFAPLRIRGNALSSIHGVNERQGVADFANVVKFYALLIQNLNDLQTSR
jgi:carboxypeptidase PM20D1